MRPRGNAGLKRQFGPRHLALAHAPVLRTASPATPRRAPLAGPTRLEHHARKCLIRFCDDHPYQADLILAWNKIRAAQDFPDREPSRFLWNGEGLWLGSAGLYARV
jgi:hypothetical protein